MKSEILSVKDRINTKSNEIQELSKTYKSSEYDIKSFKVKLDKTKLKLQNAQKSENHIDPCTVKIEKLKSILKEQFDVEESNITLETNLFTDLEADSLDLADLLTSIEDEFEIDIEADEDIAGSINTVGDIVNYISEVKGIS